MSEQEYPFQAPIASFSNGCLYHIFSTPLFACRCENTEAIQKELEVSYRNSTYEYKEDFGQTHLLSDTTFGGNVIVKDNLKELEKAIHANLSNFLGAIGFENNGSYIPNIRYKIQQSWWSKFGYRDYAHVHNHGASDISGVYYFKAESSKDAKELSSPFGTQPEGNIYFSSPAPCHTTSFVFGHYGYKQSQLAEVGKMLLFPAYLDHGVSTNETKTDRVSLAFNINFEKLDNYVNEKSEDKFK